MTAKRYHKLFRAEMTKLMVHKPGAASCIRQAATSKPDTSYIEAWSGLRRIFSYPGNTPPAN